MNSPAGVALIGAGFISYFHVLSLRRLPDLRLIAVASRSRSMAEHRSRIFAAEPYTFDELPAMLARDDIDIVLVESPVYLHAAHAIAALGAGKHLIIEKPLVLTVGEAENVEAAARVARRGIGYAENLVFTPLSARAREVVASGTLGRLRRVVGRFKHGGPPRGSWFWQPDLSGGGAHLDLGSHALETALFLAGRPEVERIVTCRMRRESENGVDISAEAVMQTAAGVEVITESSWSDPKGETSFEVVGDDATLQLRFAPPPQSLTLRRSGREESIDVPRQFDLRFDAIVAGMGYSGQMEHFVSCFRSGEAPRESVEDGTRVLRLLAAGYLAASRGRAVEPGEVPTDRSPISLLDR